MGGDRGPKVVLSGIKRVAQKYPHLRFIIHGNEEIVYPIIRRHKVLNDRFQINHTKEVISMDAKPSQIIRRGHNTSMWKTIESLKNGFATVAVSCGNTGALMAASLFNLKKAEGITRPAIACLCPSSNPAGFNVLLDAGADIRADEKDLLCYAIMGNQFAKNGLAIKKPRIGILNVGTEPHKGRPEIKTAYELVNQTQNDHGFDFVGFVEGTDIFSTNVDVIVTDGFTGNTAIKTSEGAALVIHKQLRAAFRHTPFSRIGAFFAYTSLRRFFKKIDPRRANGGVFLGLDGVVIKSHGSSDAIGIYSAIKLGMQLENSRNLS